jgi:3-hydroxyacyl-CoA dehydrogenase / enoyl-CoA hydratase / 3-hydroxybutyryl-CoA epimerase
LYIQIIEMIACVESGIIGSLQEANLGTLIGGGFSPYHGGAVQFIVSEGLDKFKNRAEQLAEFYGQRFQLPAQMASFETKLDTYQNSL